VLAGEAGADMTKIDLGLRIARGGNGSRATGVDGIEAIRTAASYGMPFDIPGNDELSGVPAWKTLAGLLITSVSVSASGARPILKPLFCLGPHIVING